MLEFHVLIHVLVLSPATIYYVSGDGKLPTPKKPELFVFGWPDIISATASMESIPMEGTIQYDLFYNLTCHFRSFNASIPLALVDLSPVNGCHKIENQLSSSLTSKGFSCSICNNIKECAHMRISKDNDLCLCLRVNTSFGFAHTCMERNVRYKIFFPPPRNIELKPTAKRQLTVQWENPNGITPKGSEIQYKVILQDQFGKCPANNIVEIKSGNTMFNFTNLTPWCSYSVTICSELQSLNIIPVNTTACTCGNDYHIPGGPVFAHTLPEEPSDHPILEPCEAFCDDSNFTVTLKWKARKDLRMYGIPQNSTIRILNSSPSIPIAVFSVPLKPNYNGSLQMYTIRNLPIQSDYTAKLQFCSNGGCGPDITLPLGCDVCESLRTPGTSSPSGTPSHVTSDKWPAVAVGVSGSALIVAVFCLVINKKRRPRNRQALGNVIGDLQPRVYEEPDSADRTSEDASYNSLESLLSSNNNQSERWV